MIFTMWISEFFQREKKRIVSVRSVSDGFDRSPQNPNDMESSASNALRNPWSKFPGR